MVNPSAWCPCKAVQRKEDIRNERVKFINIFFFLK